MLRIAFVGLGKMGEPMVANLLGKGFPVTIVGHKRPEPLETLKALGARVASTPAEAAKDCNVAILMLPGSAEVENAINGDGGLAGSMPNGSVVLDCSTSNPASTRKLAKALAENGVGFVDAGVTRGVPGAKQGKLAYFIGGTKADFDHVKPALDAMGDTYCQMGGVGAGHETKNLSNALSYATVALVSEVLSIGRGLRLDLVALQEALMSGAASKALESFGPRMIEKTYTPPRVSVANVRSHLAVTAEMAPARASLTLMPHAKEMFEEVANKGLNDADMAAIAELWPDE